MTLPQLNAVIRGYESHLFDLECLVVKSGFWSGYYSNTKRPKSLKSVLEVLSSNFAKARAQSKAKSKTESESRPEVDIETYLRREERFKKHRR